jgi:hypothetical protein
MRQIAAPDGYLDEFVKLVSDQYTRLKNSLSSHFPFVPLPGCFFLKHNINYLHDVDYICVISAVFNNASGQGNIRAQLATLIKGPYLSAIVVGEQLRIKRPK